MMVHGPEIMLPSSKETKTRAMGSRRIFPPMFKLQVLDSYRHDHDCKGNQRATARKFNIHRRQIQKWLQCENSLRSVVAESLRQDNVHSGGIVETPVNSERRAAKLFKHEARTLKLVAQKLYPSSYPGIVLKDPVTVPIDFKGEVRKTTPEQFVPKEYQLNDTQSEASDVKPADEIAPSHKFNMNGASGGLNLKDDVSGPKLCGTHPEAKSLIRKYSRDPGQELSSRTEPSSLGVPSPPAIGVRRGSLVYPEPRLPHHHPTVIAPVSRLSMYVHHPPTSHILHQHSPPPMQRLSPHPALRPVAPIAAHSPILPITADEPYNLVIKSPAQPVESSTLPTASPGCDLRSREGSPISPVITTPLPIRVAEITADSKTSAFSPKRKWLQDSIQDKLVPEPEPLLPLKQRSKMATPPEELRVKRPCPDFSIERLCGSTSPVVKCEVRTPPAQSHSPSMYSTPYPPNLVFPPPLLLPHRTIPDLLSLYFKPETHNPDSSNSSSVKEESVSDDEETIDVLSTTPVENKTFDFSSLTGSKRRSFSVEFKLNVLDAFYTDKDCNKNQRATARKFNINRRQVQKWLSLEPELRNEACRRKIDDNVSDVSETVCAQCPQHCVSRHGLSVSVKQCPENNCVLSDLKAEPVHRVSPYHANMIGWHTHSALPVSGLHYVPFFNPCDYPKIY